MQTPRLCDTVLCSGDGTGMQGGGFRLPDEAQITVLDVGQGDGIHIRHDSLNCLIDGGSSDVSSVGAYRLEPYFLSQGVDALDYVFVTHGDDDHISGVRGDAGESDVRGENPESCDAAFGISG